MLFYVNGINSENHALQNKSHLLEHGSNCSFVVESHILPLPEPLPDLKHNTKKQSHIPSDYFYHFIVGSIVLLCSTLDLVVRKLGYNIDHFQLPFNYDELLQNTEEVGLKLICEQVIDKIESCNEPEKDLYNDKLQHVSDTVTQLRKKLSALTNCCELPSLTQFPLKASDELKFFDMPPKNLYSELLKELVGYAAGDDIFDVLLGKKPESSYLLKLRNSGCNHEKQATERNQKQLLMHLKVKNHKRNKLKTDVTQSAREKFRRKVTTSASIHKIHIVQEYHSHTTISNSDHEKDELPKTQTTFDYSDHRHDVKYIVNATYTRNCHSRIYMQNLTYVSCINLWLAVQSLPVSNSADCHETVKYDDDNQSTVKKTAAGKVSDDDGPIDRESEYNEPQEPTSMHSCFTDIEERLVEQVTGNYKQTTDWACKVSDDDVSHELSCHNEQPESISEHSHSISAMIEAENSHHTISIVNNNNLSNMYTITESPLSNLAVLVKLVQCHALSNTNFQIIEKLFDFFTVPPDHSISNSQESKLDMINSATNTDIGSNGHSHSCDDCACTKLCPSEAKETSVNFHALNSATTDEVISHAAALKRSGYFSAMRSVLLRQLYTEDSKSTYSRLKLEFGIGLADCSMGNLQEALKAFQATILSLNQCSPINEADLSLVLFKLGEVLSAQGKNQEANEHFKEAVNLYRSSKNTSLLQQKYDEELTEHLLLVNIASKLRMLDRISQSNECFKTAASCPDATPENLITCYSGWGNLLHNNGEYEEAIAVYQEAIKLSEQHDDHQSLCWIYGNLGICHINLKNKAQGIKYLLQASEHTLKHDPSPSAVSRALNNLGTGYQAVDDIEKAEKCYDDALCFALYANDLNCQARAYGNIGNVCMIQKNYEKAVPHFTEVLKICQDSSTVCTAHHNRGCARYQLAEKEREANNTQIKRIPLVYKAFGSHSSNVYINLPEDVHTLYAQGLANLEKVIENHESRFSDIRSSPNLDLFVSLFENNSKTFARAQDCAYCLGDYYRALLIAEQCHSRTLAELMLQRSSLHLTSVKLHSPLSLDQVIGIMHLQEPGVPVVVFSWTGNRLLGWVLMFDGKEVTMDTFEQEPTDELFNDKSFDVYLQYYLGQVMSGDLESTTPPTTDNKKYHKAEMEEENAPKENIEEMEIMEMSPYKKLSKLVADPISDITDSINANKLTSSKRRIILITDSTTKLIPFSSLEGRDSQMLGDKFTVRFMPSLLILGIMSQTPNVVIEVSSKEKGICIVGDPLTPPFKIDNKEWNLGPLPHAKEEAEWVGFYMKTKPLLKEEPTKEVVISRLKTAKLIHIATHGSASKGFLVLAGKAVLKSKFSHTFSADTVSPVLEDPDQILLYASDVESLSLQAGLVVLSSCDSSRGTIKGDDIQGMVRAFLLAGAQSVLTSIWKVPDKSARFFVQFLYQFLLDGHTSSEALRMASSSIRAFTEFSSMIHWSGYQITGKDVTIKHITSEKERALKSLFGRKCSPFPQLSIVMSIKDQLVDSRVSDVQIVCGSSDVSLLEPIIDFSFQYYSHFNGRIFCLNGYNEDLLDKQFSIIKQEIELNIPSLVIIDSQSIEVMDEALTRIQSLSNISIIVALPCGSGSCLDAQIGSRRRMITTHDISTLTELQVTQRLVYDIQRNHYLAPGPEERRALSDLSFLCSGSSYLTELMSSLIAQYIIKLDSPNEGLKQVYEDLKEVSELKKEAPYPVSLEVSIEEEDDLKVTSCDVVEAILTCHIKEKFISTPSLILLRCLSLFGPMPIPQTVVVAISNQILSHCTDSTMLPREIWSALCSTSLLLNYPSLQFTTSPTHNTHVQDVKLFHIPEFIINGIISTVSVLHTDGDNALSASFILSAMEELISERFSSNVFVLDCLYFPQLVLNVYSLVRNNDLYALREVAEGLCYHWISEYNL